MSLASLQTLLFKRAKTAPLQPSKVWREELTAPIESLRVSPLVRAGLHLLNDDIQRCHVLAQAHETPDGNYWHAILHRREGDFENAKYWYRRVGEHPTFRRMRERFPAWDALEFVDQCREGGGGCLDSLLRQQAEEMVLLLNGLTVTVRVTRSGDAPESSVRD